MNFLPRRLLLTLIGLYTAASAFVMYQMIQASDGSAGAAAFFLGVLVFVAAEIAVTWALLFVIFGKYTQLLKVFASLAVLAVCGSGIAHVASNDPEVLMWLPISHPYLSGLLLAGLLVLAGVLRLALHIKNRSAAKASASNSTQTVDYTTQIDNPQS